MKNLPDKLLINLKILGKIEKNGRISRSYDGVITLEEDVFYQSIRRFMNHDSRKQSINEIDSIIEMLETTIKSLLNNKVLYERKDNLEYASICEVLSIIREDILGAKEGIENLRFTYKDDINTGTKLEMILLKIKTIMRELDIKLPNLIKDVPEGMSSSIFMRIKEE
jgi:hypothetical protein